MMRIFYILLFFVLMFANVSVYRTIFAPRVLEVSVLDVGEKGNATLVRSPGGAILLIDTGPDASILRALGLALPPWRRHIDAVILTSAKKASVGGLPDIESRYHVPVSKHIGDNSAPYGASFIFDGSRITVIAPATFKISYGSSAVHISSSTPAGAYTFY